MMLITVCLSMNPNRLSGRNYDEALRVSTPQNVFTRMREKKSDEYSERKERQPREVNQRRVVGMWLLLVLPECCCLGYNCSKYIARAVGALSADAWGAPSRGCAVRELLREALEGQR